MVLLLGQGTRLDLTIRVHGFKLDFFNRIALYINLDNENS